MYVCQARDQIDSILTLGHRKQRMEENKNKNKTLMFKTAYSNGHN